MADAIVVRFDVTNPRAEKQIAQRSSNQISAVSQATRQAVREIIKDGYAQGRGPLDIALDIIGRVNRATGKREGGVIGLTGPQASAAVALRNRLRSGDPTELRKVLGMGLRNRQFDKQINKAIATGKKLPAETIAKAYRAYVSNALRFRGNTIARTETGQAVLDAAHEAFKQTLEKTGYTDRAVRKTWRTAGDAKVRDSHAAMNGQTVVGLEAVFTSPVTGARFLYPMDGSLGAGASERIQCRCLCEYNIDFKEGLRLNSLPVMPRRLPALKAVAIPTLANITTKINSGTSVLDLTFEELQVLMDPSHGR